jgi:malate permease and related proteins
MQIFLVLICLLAGFLIKRYKSIATDSHKIINLWIIYVALPAVTLKYMPFVQWEKSLLIPILMSPILWTFAWILLLWVNKYYKKIDKPTFGAILLTMALGNTSFMGFPLTKSYFGIEGFKVAIICDEANFVVMSTLGIFAAIYYGNKNQTVSVGYLIKNTLLFPSFLALLLSLTLFRIIDIGSAIPLFDGLSATLIPMALFSIGLQLDFTNIKQDLRWIIFSLGYKLFFAPTLILGLVYITKSKGIIADVSIFEAAMAPMATSVILANEYGLNTRFVGNALALGILCSLFTTYFWYLILV